MQEDEPQKPHLPGIDASSASDESVLRVHAQLRRERTEGSPVAFFTATALIVVFVFGWFYARRYFADFDSRSVLAEREHISAMARYLEEGVGPPEPVEISGAELYAQQCVACHQSEGQGNPAASIPPLAGSEWVQHDAALPIKIVLKGLSGPVTVSGEQFNSFMPPLAALKDDEIAAILTYVRSSWGNEASEVSAEEVAAVRGEIESRSAAWTAAELQEHLQ